MPTRQQYHDASFSRGQLNGARALFTLLQQHPTLARLPLPLWDVAQGLLDELEEKAEAAGEPLYAYLETLDTLPLLTDDAAATYGVVCVVEPPAKLV